ncbi:MAG: hypothetical protein PWR06_518 [Thermoanaerobacteraceae bacterium]|nr:hypothetical protein [Thermoanaerobacteraceae bacterium]MDN5303046.1 hypothetical protein [Thermoanaerobacteraceae bacterium]
MTIYIKMSYNKYIEKCIGVYIHWKTIFCRIMAYKGADLKQGDSMKTIYVCVGSSCHLKGSYDIIRALEKLIKQNHLENEVELKAEFCFGNCTKPVSVKIDDKGPYSVDKDRVEDFFRQNILGDN